MTTELQFDEEKHIYSVGGEVLPSPTQVLRDLLPYRGGPVSGSDWYMQRGRAVHAAAAMIARGEEVVIDDPDPANKAYMEGCVASIRRYFADFGPAIVASEKPLHSKRHRFAGTVDLVVCRARYMEIVDWKANFETSLPYQLAAYALLVEESDGSKVNEGYGVRYSPDGQYILSKRYDLRWYKIAFLGLLSAYNTRLKEGYIKKEERE